MLLTEDDSKYIARVLIEVRNRRRKGVKDAIHQANEVKRKALIFIQDSKDKELLEKEHESCLNTIQLEAEKDELIITKCLELLKNGSNLGGKGND